jgi:cytochrome c
MTGEAVRAGGPAIALALVMALVLALVLASRPSAAGGDAARGQKLYGECIACHSFERGVHGVGPSLYGVFNRRAGELSDYRYSPALKRSGIIWTADTLDAFIADSQQFLPANRMPYAGMPDAADRDDLVAYLQQAAQ